MVILHWKKTYEQTKTQQDYRGRSTNKTESRRGWLSNFFCYIAGVFPATASIHWLVHGHMTSDNETVFRQMPWAGNIAKTMMSNGKQFTVTREMLTAVAHGQRWPDVVAGISERFPKFAFYFVLLFNKSLNDWSLGEQWILFPSNVNVSRGES